MNLEQEAGAPLIPGRWPCGRGPLAPEHGGGRARPGRCRGQGTSEERLGAERSGAGPGQRGARAARGQGRAEVTVRGPAKPRPPGPPGLPAHSVARLNGAVAPTHTLQPQAEEGPRGSGATELQSRSTSASTQSPAASTAGPGPALTRRTTRDSGSRSATVSLSLPRIKSTRVKLAVK
ncbi:unnamed protein product [Arctogadus glacialis]